jgi:glyoxylase-like metal-dependent hydrolase (beta-lactamase superfamily II)
MGATIPKESKVLHANAGIHHFAVGDTTVTALREGVLEAATAYVAGLDGAAVEATLGSAFRVLLPRITMTCFLVERGGRNILIDAGSGTAMGEGHGQARVRLAGLGVRPSDIDTVLVTHAHVDHVGGLLDEAGQ